MIEIEGLRFKYSSGNDLVLKDINLTVNKGDFLGIIGSSGAGKTTLLHSINGIVPHYFRGDFYGSVRVNGLDTVDSSPEKLAYFVGSVRQDIESQMVASVVEDEILFGLENFGIPRAEIKPRLADALEKTGISELRNRNISTLSGGQKQKVAIAAIAALLPQVLILDEPTGELDPCASRQIFQLLRELNERHGITIVIVEQKIMLLCEYAKTLAVMRGGEIVITGPVREVLSHSFDMERSGVNIPRIVTLANSLAERGYDYEEVPVNIAEAEKMVRRIIK